MSFPITNRALLRALLAGAVVVTGTACSRPDRDKSGPDNTAAVVSDTSSNAAQPSNSGTVTGSVSDTAMPADQPTTSAPSNTPRAESAPSEKDAAGYRSMERDTTSPSNQDSDSARVTADTSVSQASPVSPDSATTDMSAVGRPSAEVADSTDVADTTDVANTTDVADTAAAGYTEMARDTSTVPDQADTAAVSGDVALEATVDTTSEANAEVSVETGVAADSTEILGGETADEQVVRPEDRETVAVSEAPKDDVGAAAIGGDVTGADAVALMTREGVRCAVVDLEENQAIRWDMSSTPISLNPCGMGSMVLSKIWTRVE